MKPQLPLLSSLVVVIIIIMNFSSILGNIRNAIGGLFKPQSYSFQATPEQQAQGQAQADAAFAAKGLTRGEDGVYRRAETPSPAPVQRAPSVLGATEKKPIPPQVMGTYGRSSKARALKPDRTVIDAISKAADQYKVPADLLFDIAAQESMFNPTARAAENGFPDSSATGLFQFTNGTWDTVNNYGKMPGSTLKLPSNDRLDPYANAAAAAYLIANGQLGRWNASQNVWGSGYDLQDLMDFYSQTGENEIPQHGWR